MRSTRMILPQNRAAVRLSPACWEPFPAHCLAEVPDHDAGMRFGIRKVIFAGDLIATDQDALNTWLSTWAEDGERSYFADLDELRKIIRRFQEWFTEGIYMIMGNHDLRIDKKTGGQVTLEMLLDDTDMKFSRYSYMYIWIPRLREWVYVCHQFNYSKTSVRLAQDVWAVVTAPDGYDNETGERIPGYDEWRHGKNKQKCHVLVTHTHVAQDGFSPDGNWRTIGMGCMRDARRTKYKRARATKFPEWNPGFVMLRDGHFHVLTKHGTDWPMLLGDDYYAILMERGP